MNTRQLEKLGCNDSSIHTDIMVGSSEVSITATESAEGCVPLIVDGHWCEPFLDPS